MKYPIHHVSDIGQVVRAVRKESGVRQDDVAGSAGVSHVYLRDLERGKETTQMGLALQVLAELGIRLEVDIPDAAYEHLKSALVRQEKKRMSEEPKTAESLEETVRSTSRTASTKTKAAPRSARSQ